MAKYCLTKNKKTGNLLFSQGQAQLSSPLKCLTSVFGMGTGVSTLLSSPDFLILKEHNLFSQNRITVVSLSEGVYLNLRSSPRPISISPLHTSLCFHS